MNIGISASLLDNNGYGRWKNNMYKKLKEHGYSCTDYNMSNTETEIYTAPQKAADSMLLHEKELAADACIEIVQVHGPWQWPPRDFTVSEREERMQKMKKSIRATAVLGCKNWVVHPIMPYGIDEINTVNAKKTWDINVTFMNTLLKTAKEYDVTICLENMPMPNFSLAKPEEILRFVETINDDNLKICLDTGHVAVYDDLNLGDEVRRLSNKIRALHVHDNSHGMDLHMMPYFGIIDWSDFAAALHDIKFDGCFSLETAPPSKLPDTEYEDMCKLLFKIASNIARDI